MSLIPRTQKTLTLGEEPSDDEEEEPRSGKGKEGTRSSALGVRHPKCATHGIHPSNSKHGNIQGSFFIYEGTGSYHWTSLAYLKHWWVMKLTIICIVSGLGTCFIFPCTGNGGPKTDYITFFRRVETTNQV